MISLGRILFALILAAGVQAQDNQAGDEDLLQALEERLQLRQATAGEFRQLQYIAVLPQPLSSSGRFSYHPEDGLIWETLEPIPNRLEFDDAGIRQSVEGDTVWEVGADQPAAVTITRVISRILAADWPGLREYFAIEGSVEPQHWELDLQPRDEVLGQVVESITLSGDEALSTMVLHEPGGDRSEIHFDISAPGAQ